MTASSVRTEGPGWPARQKAPEPRPAVWLSYAVLLAGLGAGLASAYLVFSTYSPLPYWDEWALFDHLARGGSGWSLSWLLAQHNEHRILVPKVFFLLDVEFFHGRQAFLLASIFLVQIIQVALLSGSLRWLAGVRGAAWRIGTGLIGYCILCPTQYENLVSGFQLQFVLPAAMATLSSLTLLLYDRDKNADRVTHSWLLAVCVAAATIATWSLANGMLLWPILLLGSLCLRRVSFSWLVLLAAGTLNIGLYLYQYHRPAPTSGVVPLPSVGEHLRYVTVYFGSTFVRHSAGAVALVVGAVGLGIAIVVIVAVLLRRRRAPLFFVELSLLMLFCIATAAITSSGRLQLGQEQATASRYQTFALLFWCCLGLILLAKAAARPGLLQVLAGVLLLMMLGFATQLRLPLIDAQWRQQRLSMVSMALLSGVEDPAVLADAYPDPQVVRRVAPYMAQHHLSILSGKEQAQIGQPLDSGYRVLPSSDCSGYVSSSQVVPAISGRGLRLTGFAWDRQRQRPAERIIATIGGRISGLGTNVAIPLTLGNAGAQADAARYGWAAFIRDSNPGSRIDLYAVVGKGSSEVCRFAEASP